MTLKTVQTPELPDDPRDCCRAILDVLRPLDEAPVSRAPADFARLVAILMESDDTGALEEARQPLQRLANQVIRAADAYQEAADRAWTLARHGTED